MSPSRDRMSRVVLLVAATLIPGLATPGAWCADPEFRNFEREAFTVDLPAWPVITDQGRPDLGQYRMSTEEGTYFAEVVWKVEDPASLVKDELRDVLRAFIETPQFTEGKIINEGTRENQLWFKAAASVQGGWMRLGSVTCLNTGLTVTLGLGGVDKPTVERLHDRTMDSVTCRGESYGQFAGTLKVTSVLGPEFGHYREGELVLLADGAGRTLIVLDSPPQVVLQASAQAENIVGMFANLLESEIEVLDDASRQRSPSGSDQIVIRGNKQPSKEAFVVGALNCPSTASGFLILAWHDGGVSDHRTLAGLVGKIDCPQSGNPDYDQRKTACDVGAPYCG